MLATMPATIAAGLSWSAWRNTSHGPWKIGGNHYALLVDATSNHAEMWKSTDGGNTWAEQDSANHPVIDTTSAAYKSVVGIGRSAHGVQEERYGPSGCDGPISGPSLEV